MNNKAGEQGRALLQIGFISPIPQSRLNKLLEETNWYV